MLTVRSFVLLIIFGVSLENTCRQYTKRTEFCPRSKTEWDKRTTELPCSDPGRAYTCMILKDNQGSEPDHLVETCINSDYRIADGFPGCPYILDCDEDGPSIGTELSFIQCNESLPGCPPKYHGGYAVTELYKYQACLMRNKSDLLRLTTGVSTEKTIEDERVNGTNANQTTPTTNTQTTTTQRLRLLGVQRRNNTSNIPAENKLLEIIVPSTLAVVLIISVIGVCILCRRRIHRNLGNCQQRMCPHPDRSDTFEEIPLIPPKSRFKDPLVHKFHQMLTTFYREETQRVILAPLHHFITEPLEMIYAPVSIRKDLEEKEYIDEEYRPNPEPVETPDDIFMKNGRQTRFVMMRGEAGRGKSVYCLNLVRHWCNAMQDETRQEKSHWTIFMEKIDFLFLVKLRNEEKGTTLSLVDMICQDIQRRCQGSEGAEYVNTTHTILSSGEYKCLIIIDGLDEWNEPDMFASEKGFSDIPDLEGICRSTCTFFFTMRPWKFEALIDIIGINDRIIQIDGLDEEGKTILFKNFITNHLKKEENSTEYHRYLRDFKEKAANVRLKSLLNIPLIAIVSLLLWSGKEKVGNCITTFYLTIIKILIERAEKNETIDKKLKDSVKNAVIKNKKIPNLIRSSSTLYDVYENLCKLGKVAFDDLRLKQNRLVFDKTELAKQIEVCDLDFALKTGILTISEKIVSISEPKKSIFVSFFHKTVQELLLAMYVSSKEEASRLYLEHLDSLKTILEFELVNMFISGLSPSLGETLSQHIVKVANTDPDVCEYRKSFHYKLVRKVELLYKMQLGCLWEMQQSEKDTTKQRDYHISDVYVNVNSDTDTVRMTANVLRNHNSNIVSLYIQAVPNDQNGIEDAVINNYLTQTTRLTSLDINAYNTNRTINTINTVASLKALVLYRLHITPSLLHDIQTSLHNNTHLHTLGLVYIKCTCVDSGEVRHDSVQTLTTSFCGLLENLPGCKQLSKLLISRMLKEEERDMFVGVISKLSQLKAIDYYGGKKLNVGDDKYDRDLLADTVSQLTELQMLELDDISLGDKSLVISENMIHIELVWLSKVEMSLRGWGKFITSLECIQHQFDVSLRYTNISACHVNMIRSSPHFTVKCLQKDKRGMYRLDFTREFPTTSQTRGRSGDDVESAEMCISCCF